jgi:hypothetical protein
MAVHQCHQKRFTHGPLGAWPEAPQARQRPFPSRHLLILSITTPALTVLGVQRPPGPVCVNRQICEENMVDTMVNTSTDGRLTP